MEQGRVTAGNYDYYMITLNEMQDIMIETTPTRGGDPDLYVACGYKPSAVHSTWKSDTIGADSVLVSASDPNYCKTGESWMIGITTKAGNATFVVSANVDPSHRPSMLISGVPLAGTVPAGGFLQFSWVMPMVGRSASFSLTPLAGDPDLYVGCTWCPNYDAYYWSSTSSRVDTISIQPSDAHMCRNRTFFISVYGFNGDAKFLVSAKSGFGEPETLIASTPDDGSASPGTYAYYSFGVDAPDADVFIDMTPISGDGDMYVSCSGEGKPTKDHFRWSSLQPGRGLEHLAFTSSDNRCPDGENYVIGIYGSSAAPAFFSILATSTEHQDPVPLLPGVPQAGLSANQMKYFTVDLTNVTARAQKVTFNASVTDGSMQLFVSSAGALPTKKSHQWVSAFTWTTTSVTVLEADPLFLGPPLTVGVLCSGSGTGSSPAQFTITAFVDKA